MEKKRKRIGLFLLILLIIFFLFVFRNKGLVSPLPEYHGIFLELENGK